VFRTRLVVEAADARGEWVVKDPLVWDTGAVRVTVPAGYITDLASIPRALRSVFDINGPSRKPAVLHDWLYCSQIVSRGTADALFRDALAWAGMGWVHRTAYYLGVRMGGWVAWREATGGPRLRDFATAADFCRYRTGA
jgi:hypothetical protein